MQALKVGQWLQIVELAHRGYINAAGKGGGISRIIKKGEVTIQNKEKTEFLLNCITDVLSIVPRRDRDGNFTFIGCYVGMLIEIGSAYNHNKFLSYLEQNRQKFLLVTQDTEEILKLLKKAAISK